MAQKNTYRSIVKYVVTAICTQPLHVGNAVGEKEQVLVHPVNHLPFVQASSIAGVFRGYCENTKGKKVCEELFGYERLQAGSNAFELQSKLRMEDGVILKDKNEDAKGLQMELRPHVSIDDATGTCKSQEVQGSNVKAGNKFNMEYIGAGTKIKFSMYLYEEDLDSVVREILSAMNGDTIQFGGKKSNGCGYMKVEKLLYKKFDMTKKNDRTCWYREDSLRESEYEDITKTLKFNHDDIYAYRIAVKAKTENQLLVKSLVVSDYGKDAPKAVNIQNAKDEYIIPGSSFKGAIRSQMTKIAGFLQQKGILTEDVIGNTFGMKGKDYSENKVGNIRFFDTVVGNKEENDKAELSHRIHIDKFTGGVMNGSLFSEKNISGQMNFSIGILNKNNPEQSCAVLLYALRDLAVGMMSVGSGYSIGKGYVNVDKIEIQRADKKTAVIDITNGSVQDSDHVIANCFLAMNRKEC